MSDEPEKPQAAKGSLTPPAADQDQLARPVAPSQPTPPMAPPGVPQAQFNIGLALGQLSRPEGLAALPPESHARVLSTVSEMDQRQAAFAHRQLESGEKVTLAEIEDGGKALKLSLLVGGGLAALVVIAIAVLAAMLIAKDQYGIAEKILIGMLTAGGGLLGGVGLKSAYDKIAKRSEE